MRTSTRIIRNASKILGGILFAIAIWNLITGHIANAIFLAFAALWVVAIIHSTRGWMQ